MLPSKEATQYKDRSCPMDDYWFFHSILKLQLEKSKKSNQNRRL